VRGANIAHLQRLARIEFGDNGQQLFDFLRRARSYADLRCRCTDGHLAV
jgi:hypothetical protein